MILRGIIYNALLIGLLIGLLLTGLQALGVTPIIHAAEQYESVSLVSSLTDTQPASHDHAAHDHASHDHSAQAPAATVNHHDADEAAGHHHDAQAWMPADGGERLFYTALSNVISAIGFAAIMLALMNQLRLQGLTSLSVSRGLAWGLAGFTAFFLAPAIGLPPEIPGIEAATLENRQGWWLLTVLSVGIGLGLLAFAPRKIKTVSLIFFAMPYILGAPHPDGHAFAHSDPAVVAELTDLHIQFIVASAISNLLFWLMLGATCAWAVNRWTSKGVETHATANT